MRDPCGATYIHRPSSVGCRANETRSCTVGGPDVASSHVARLAEAVGQADSPTHAWAGSMVSTSTLGGSSGTLENQRPDGMAPPRFLRWAGGTGAHGR